MKKLLLVGGLMLTGCAPEYYVASVYADPHGGMIQKRCPVPGSGLAGVDGCHYERVAAAPAFVLEKPGVASTPAPAK